MIKISSEIKDSFAALADGDYEEFVKRFWAAENLTCDLGEGPCALTLLDAWLLNGFKFALDFMDKVAVLDAGGRDGVALTSREQDLRQSVSIDACSFLRYCELYDLSPKTALAMWPEPFRTRVLTHVEAFARTNLSNQIEALRIVQPRFVDTFESVMFMYQE